MFKLTMFADDVHALTFTGRRWECESIAATFKAFSYTIESL